MNPVRMHVRTAGSCTHPEHVLLRNLRARPLHLPNMFAAIEHPREGLCLYDTGYAPYFFEATRRFPEKLYALVTPVRLDAGHTALAQLEALGYQANDVRSVVISHFHADHIAALRDFPRARFRCLSRAYDAVRGLSGIRGLCAGFLPALLPSDFEARLDPIDGARQLPLPGDFAPFQRGYDLFGDGSVLGVPLEGHAAGQLGLFVHGADGLRYLFVADACWTSEAFERPVLPHAVSRLLFDDYERYGQVVSSLNRLFQRSPRTVIVPSHCARALARIGPLELGT